MNRELRVFRHEDTARAIAAAISTREDRALLVRFNDGYRVVVDESLVGLPRGRLVSAFEHGKELQP